MEHVAIDLGGSKSQICVRTETGEIVEEKRIATDAIGAYLKRRAPSRVIVETCAEAFHVADQARAAGHEHRIVAATLVRTLGVGARRNKSDRRDAHILSEVSCRIDLPSVHLPSQRSREWKAICGARDALVRSRTLLANSIRGWARTQGIRVVTKGPEGLPGRMQMFGPPSHIVRMLESVEALTKQIKQATKELKDIAERDPICKRLMTVPGVGPITAIRFVAAIDQRERFESAHAVESYLGLVPGESSSGESRHRLSITKAGASDVRWTLIQAAWSARRTRPNDSMVLWSRGIEQRRGKFIAVVALARKITGILFAMWRDATDYAPRME